MLDTTKGTFDPEQASAVTLERRRLGLTALDREKSFGGYTLYARRDRWNDPLLRRFRKWATSAVLADYPALKSAT